MRVYAAASLAFVLFLSLANGSPAESYDYVPARRDLASIPARTLDIAKRDGHEHHGSHAKPLYELNETEVTMHHAPTPESYYTIDLENADHSGATRHPGLIFAHAALMSLAFFVVI